MALASRLKWYLEVNRMRYEVLDRASGAQANAPAETSDATPFEHPFVPLENLAKSIVLEDDEGYLMVILPASRCLDLDGINDQLHRHLSFVSEEEASGLFFDCESGSIPAVGSAYGLPTLIDDALLSADDIYFDAGDREGLVHVDSADFMELNTGSLHARVSGNA